MKIIFFMLTLFFSFDLYATCTSENTTVTGVINIPQSFSSSGSYTESIISSFGPIKCTASGESLNYWLPLKVIYFSLYNDSLKLKMEISDPEKGQVIIGNSTKVVSVSHSLHITPANNSDKMDFSSSNGSVTIESIIQASTIRNLEERVRSECENPLTTKNICMALRMWWYNFTNPSQVSFAKNVTISYVPPDSTCDIENDVNITLPDVSLSALPQSGMVSNIIGQGNIILNCINSLNGNSTRNASVFLSSVDLKNIGNDNILIDNNFDGIGFILSDQNDNKIKISSSQSTRAGATSLQDIQKGLPLRASYNIPIKARYYVYDKNKIHPGDFSALAKINIIYD
ncbi:fimbrial protein [Citrobacter portucalensis]|uniref:fimbrial protein n=1 Tax=Citrobacter portucalensis TaxID=1639133 RepID=UPI003EDF633A